MKGFTQFGTCLPDLFLGNHPLINIDSWLSYSVRCLRPRNAALKRSVHPGALGLCSVVCPASQSRVNLDRICPAHCPWLQAASPSLPLPDSCSPPPVSLARCDLDLPFLLLYCVLLHCRAQSSDGFILLPPPTLSRVSGPRKVNVLEYWGKYT